MSKYSNWVLGLLTCLFCVNVFSATIHQSLYIKGDSLTLVTGNKIPYLTFNNSGTYDQKNARIELDIQDSLSMWVYNNDTIAHEFEIKNVVFGLSPIPSGDSLFIGYKFNNAGCYIFYDPQFYTTGLGGMIVVKNHAYSSFYWNMKTHQSNWNEVMLNNGTVDWTTYHPDYYTINGSSFPDLMSDTDSRITGQLGDTLMVYMANTGKSIHSVHLHGYHASIVFSSKDANHVGREKDTFPIYPLETLVLKLVPDKSGEYPIHDHNLVAVSGNGLYPNGMLSTILIVP